MDLATCGTLSYKKKILTASLGSYYELILVTCDILDSLVSDSAAGHVEAGEVDQVPAHDVGHLVRGDVSDVELSETHQTRHGADQGPGEVPAAGDLSILGQTIPQSLTDNKKIFVKQSSKFLQELIFLVLF